MFCILERFFPALKRSILHIKFRHVCTTFVILMILQFFGIFTHIFEVSFEDNFSYPYEGDVSSSVEALKHNKKPEIEPINTYNYDYIHDIKENCIDNDYHTLRIIFIVKSAIDNFDRRNAIRNSWGHKKRFFDVPTRTVFLLGINPMENKKLQSKLDDEIKKHKDIVQGNYIDTYYNNTIKTMMGLKWAVNYCLNSKFYMFVDDDIYVSVKNVLRFIRNPTSYPDYLQDPSRIGGPHKREIRESDVPNLVNHLPNSNSSNSMNKTSTDNQYRYQLNVTLNNESLNNDSDGGLIRKRRQVFDFELPNDVMLFAGYVFVSSPHRYKSSKWYVSLDEYKYDMWPPYVTAGAYILSKEALIDLYYTSFYTKHFKFDDIYLGLVAKKAGIEPFHCDEFHFYKKEYTKYNYKYVITSHGYGDPAELMHVWNEQKSLGNA
ncbi:beta-1,3-galactosyltransferase brn [Microplitis demolitor]|uniref:beta-1,3-galactosyltransferase brn n=1 Tax=Microplitis demolitor TaxID=69319 RepID=UPI0004CC9896|nr:beta-1,3-galactosyltransferase brn [Microplitis demolitor]